MFALRPEAREFKPSGVDMAPSTTDNADSTVNNSSKYRCLNDVIISTAKVSGVSTEFQMTTLDSVDQRLTEENVHHSFSRKDRASVPQTMPLSKVSNAKVSTNKELFTNSSHIETGNKHDMQPSHPLKEEQFIRTTLNPDAPPFVPTVDPPFLYDNSPYCGSAGNSISHSASTIGNANVMPASGLETMASQGIKQGVAGPRLIINPTLTYLTSYPITDESLLQPLDKSFHPDASVCTTSPYVTPTAHQYMAHIGDTVRPIVGNNSFSKFCVSSAYAIASPINTVNFRPASPCAIQQPCMNGTQYPPSDIGTLPGSFEPVNDSTSPNNSLPKSSYRVTTPVVPNSSDEFHQTQRTVQDKVMVPNDLNKIYTKGKEFVQPYSDTKKSHLGSNARLAQENMPQSRLCNVKLNDTLNKALNEYSDKSKKEQFVKEVDEEKKTVSQSSRQNYTFINKEKHSVKHGQNIDVSIESEKRDSNDARMDILNQTKLNENSSLGKSSRVANCINLSNVNSNDTKSADFRTMVNHLENTPISKRSTKRHINPLTTSTVPLRKQPVVASGKQRGDFRCGVVPSKQNGRNNKSVNRGKKNLNVANQFTTSVSKSTAGQDTQVETSMTCSEIVPKKEDLETNVQSKSLVKEQTPQPTTTLPRVSTRKGSSWAELVRSGPSKPVVTEPVPPKTVVTQPVPPKTVVTQPVPPKAVVTQPVPPKTVVAQPVPPKTVVTQPVPPKTVVTQLGPPTTVVTQSTAPVLSSETSAVGQMSVPSLVTPPAVSASVAGEKSVESVVAIGETPVASTPTTVSISQEKSDAVTQVVAVAESVDCGQGVECCSQDTRGNQEEVFLNVTEATTPQHALFLKHNGNKKSVSRDNDSVTPCNDEQKLNRSSRNPTMTRYKQPTNRFRGDGRLRGDNTNRRQYESQAKFPLQKTTEGTYSNRGRHTNIKRNKGKKETDVLYQESVVTKECVTSEESSCTQKVVSAVEEKPKATTWVSVALGESKTESVIGMPQKILSGATEVTHVSSSKRKIGNAPLSTMMQPLGASCEKNHFVLKPQNKPTHDTGANVEIQNSAQVLSQERHMYEGSASSITGTGQHYVEAAPAILENNFQEPRNSLRKAKAYAHTVPQSYAPYGTTVTDDMNGTSKHRVETVHRHRAVKLMNAPMPVTKPIPDYSYEQHKNIVHSTNSVSNSQTVETSSHEPAISSNVVSEQTSFDKIFYTLGKCVEECKTSVVNDACVEKNVDESAAHEPVSSDHDISVETRVEGPLEPEKIVLQASGLTDKENIIKNSSTFSFKISGKPSTDSSMQQVEFISSNTSEDVSKLQVRDNKQLLQACDSSTPLFVPTNTTQSTTNKNDSVHRVREGFLKSDDLRCKSLNCSTFVKENGKSIEQVLENSKHIFKDMKPSFSKDMPTMTHYHNGYYACVSKENKFVDKQSINYDHEDNQGNERDTVLGGKESPVMASTENATAILNEKTEEKHQEKNDTLQGSKRLLKAPSTRVYSIRLMVSIRNIMLQKHELNSPEFMNKNDTTKSVSQTNFAIDPSRKGHMKLLLHPKGDRQFINECNIENNLTFFDSQKKDGSENIQYIWRRQTGMSTNDTSPIKGNYQGNAGGPPRCINFTRQGTKHSFSNTRGKSTTAEDDLAGVWRTQSAPIENSRLAIANRITDHKELIERSLRALLNKLTMEKFDTLYEKIRLSGMVDREDIKCLMRLICSKAKTQHHFIPMYVKLCVRLHQDIPKLNVKMEDESEFRRLLVDACQASFEETLKPIVVPEGLNEEDTFEYILYEKKKMKGNMIFVGELGKTRMIAGRVIYNCINSLIANRGEAQLEALCVLMRTTGEYMEAQKFRESFIHKLETVAELAKDQTISKRLRCLLQDVVDDSRNGWVKSKKEKDGPKKLNDLRKELESRQKVTTYFRTDYTNSNPRPTNSKDLDEDFQQVSGKRHPKMNKPQNSTQDFLRSNTLKPSSQYNSNNRMEYHPSQLSRLSAQSRAEYSNNSFHRNTAIKRGGLSGKDSYHKENDSCSIPFFETSRKNKHQTLESVEELLHSGNVSSIKELSCVKLPENSPVLDKTTILRKEQPLNLFDTENAKNILDSSCRAYNPDNAESCNESLDAIRFLIESQTLTEQDFSFLIGTAIASITEARVARQPPLVQWLLDWRKQGLISSEHFNLGFTDFIKTRYHSVKYDAPNLDKLLVDAFRNGEEQKVFTASFVQGAIDLIQKAENGEFRTDD